MGLYSLCFSLLTQSVVDSVPSAMTLVCRTHSSLTLPSKLHPCFLPCLPSSTSSQAYTHLQPQL